MNKYLEFTFPDCDGKRDILLALLQTIHFEGFNETADNILKAYIDKELYNKTDLESLLSQINLALNFTVEDLPDVNWNKEWESNFDPIFVDDFCIIRADFHNIERQAEHIITINPKQAFGTGHHETTFMMIQKMADLDLNGKSVLDIGTGTGILAILGELLGADHILGTENDKNAITNAIENIEVNHCKKIQIENHLYPLTNVNPDIILANINMNVLFEYSETIKSCIKKGGTVFLSGILESQLASVLLEYTKDNKLHKRSVKTKGEWCLIELIA